VRMVISVLRSAIACKDSSMQDLRTVMMLYAVMVMCVGAGLVLVVIIGWGMVEVMESLLVSIFVAVVGVPCLGRSSNQLVDTVS